MIFETVQEWAHCREAMLKAIERCEGTHTEDDVLEAILRGNMRLIREGTSGVVIEIHTYPRMKALHCFLVAGNMDEVLRIEERLPALARSLGCSRITACGRHGWAKVLPNHGWETVTTFMQKDVC